MISESAVGWKAATETVDRRLNASNCGRGSGPSSRLSQGMQPQRSCCHEHTVTRQKFLQVMQDNLVILTLNFFLNFRIVCLWPPSEQKKCTSSRCLQFSRLLGSWLTAMKSAPRTRSLVHPLRLPYECKMAAISSFRYVIATW